MTRVRVLSGRGKISKSQNLKIFCLGRGRQACKPTKMQAVDMHAGTKSRIQNQNPESRIQTPRAGSLDFVRIRGMIPGSEMRRAVFTARQNCKKFSCTSAKLFVPWILLAGLQNHESKSESRIGASLAPRILRGECKTQNIVMGGRWKLQIVRAECKTENVLSEPSKEVCKMSKYARSESKL